VPSSDASASEAAFHGVPLTTLAEAGGVVDLLVDVASELDVGPSGGLSYIVGRGASGTQVAQPCLPRLRALLAAARRCVVVAEREEDCTGRLGGSLPVEVEGEGWEEAGEELDDVFIGDAEVWRRGAQEGAGPRGGDRPVLTAGGHQILDVRFAEGLKLFGEAAAYAEIAAAIEAVPGVVAHGLVAGRAAAAVVAGRDGPLAVAAHECMGAAAGEEA
jgi:ribose 5-phosphate isomerase A